MESMNFYFTVKRNFIYVHLYFFQIWRINTKYNVLYVQGHGVAGLPHTFVRIRDTYIPKKRLNPEKNTDVSMPTWYPEDVSSDPLPEEIFHQDMFQFTDPTIIGEESAA